MRTFSLFFMLFIFVASLFADGQIGYVEVQGKGKENRNCKIWYRVPSSYKENSKSKFRVLIFFGGRNFSGDGLALIERNGTKYINEPHAGGGNPILAIGESSEDAIFNDILGTSLGVVKESGYFAIDKTSFGADSTDKSSFFTGKPYIEDLGYAFLFRNYRADLGKWQMRDLIGYPDGWNNLAYCNNGIIEKLDYLGCYEIISATFSNMKSIRGNEIIYTPTYQSYILVPVSGTVSFTLKKETGDASNATIRVAAQSDNSRFYGTLNVPYDSSQSTIVVRYNIEGIIFSYRGDGIDSGDHWFRFGVAVESSPGNYTSPFLSNKVHFNLKEVRE